MIRVIDNLIPKYYLKELQDYFLSKNCEWYYNDNLTGDESFENLSSFGLTMRLHWNGNFIGSFPGTLVRALVFSAQEQVESVSETNQRIVRVRADMTLYNPLNHRHELHTDFPEEHMTAIFYVNNSDGNTLLYNREGTELIQEVEPVENRLLIFDGLMQHTGHSPSKHKSRLLVNMNFMTPDLVNQLNQRYGYNGR